MVWRKITYRFMNQFQRFHDQVSLCYSGYKLPVSVDEVHQCFTDIYELQYDDEHSSMASFDSSFITQSKWDANSVSGSARMSVASYENVFLRPGASVYHSNTSPS